MKWSWPLIIILSVLATGLVRFIFPDLVGRPLIVLWFLAVCPGMMLVRFFKFKDIVTEWTLAIALSFAIDTFVACIFLYSGRWSPAGILVILLGLCFVGSFVQLMQQSAMPATRPNSLDQANR